MRTIFRASNPLKQGSVLRSARALVFNSEILSKDVDNKFEVSKYSQSFDECLDLRRFYHTRDVPVIFGVRGRGLSSQAGTKSGEEDELEDELLSSPELSEEDDVDDGEEATQSELDLPDAETEGQTEIFKKKWSLSKLASQLVTASGPIREILDKWVKEGKDLDRSEVISCLYSLRKRRFYLKALQLLEWLDSNKQYEFGAKDYASRLDLIAKVRGLQKAEQYLEQIPECFRGEIVYRTLLANYVLIGNVNKVEQVFNRMKDLKFPISTFACNQLLLLYKRTDKKKIADVLLVMEKENVKPSSFTYRLLIDAKGQLNDMSGMDQIVETMKAEGMELDVTTQALLAKHYLAGGLKKKAENLLKEIEGGSLSEQRWTCRVLLPIYGEFGKSNDVERIWKVCENNPRVAECMAAIEAFGKLKNVEKAEVIFEKMSNRWKRLSSKNYSSLLKVYINNKMLGKGKDLVKRMADSGCHIGPLTWDALVKLYVEAGDVEKADSLLQKAAHNNKLKPLFTSYMIIMEDYARRGDIHNAEKMFYRMRLAGYTARLRQFQTLVQAYINAKSPAYGIRDRMKADNLFPNKALAGQLVKVDAFRKTAVSDLLD